VCWLAAETEEMPRAEKRDSKVAKSRSSRERLSTSTFTRLCPRSTWKAASIAMISDLPSPVPTCAIMFSLPSRATDSERTNIMRVMSWVWCGMKCVPRRSFIFSTT